MKEEGKPPDIAIALMEPKGGKKPAGPEPDGDEGEEKDAHIEVSEEQVNAARAVRAAIKGGDDEELAQALCGFYRLEG